MIGWILLGVLAVVLVFGALVLRGVWQESAKKIGALPPKQVRRTWPAPSAVGQRVMWCPILASKVVLSDTKVEEGTLGSVTRLTDDGLPVVAFDGVAGSAMVDRWGAARVVPAEHDKKTKAAPTRANRRGRSKNARRR